MFSKLLKKATSLFDEGEKLVSRAWNQDQFIYVVYAAYLIASADGDFDSDEKAALIKLIKKDFPAFNKTHIVEAIAECDAKLAFDKTLGMQEILDVLATADAEDARLIMRICAYIGAADGDYDASEKAMARSIAYALKLSPSDFNL